MAFFQSLGIVALFTVMSNNLARYGIIKQLGDEVDQILGSEHMCIGVLRFVSMNTANFKYSCYSRSSVSNSAVTTCRVSFKLDLIGPKQIIVK
jgi:hypothetical protein